MWRKELTVGDIVIFFILVLGSLLAMLFSGAVFSGADGTLAVVEVNGSLYGEYSLQEKNGKILEIETEFGYNKIVIENGEVRVTESDCPDGLEISAGSIRRNGETLVCLPNRLIIRVAGEKEVDGLAY